MDNKNKLRDMINAFIEAAKISDKLYGKYNPYEPFLSKKEKEKEDEELKKLYEDHEEGP